VSLNLSIDLISNTSKFLFLLQIQKKTFLTAKEEVYACAGLPLALAQIQAREEEVVRTN
jgi:hypothetical protein